MISKPIKHLMLVTSIFIEPNYVQQSPPGEAKFPPVKKLLDFYGNQSFITAFTQPTTHTVVLPTGDNLQQISCD